MHAHREADLRPLFAEPLFPLVRACVVQHQTESQQNLYRERWRRCHTEPFSEGASCRELNVSFKSRWQNKDRSNAVTRIEWPRRMCVRRGPRSQSGSRDCELGIWCLGHKFYRRTHTLRFAAVCTPPCPAHFRPGKRHASGRALGVAKKNSDRGLRVTAIVDLSA